MLSLLCTYVQELNKYFFLKLKLTIPFKQNVLNTYFKKIVDKIHMYTFTIQKYKSHTKIGCIQEKHLFKFLKT